MKNVKLLFMDVDGTLTDGKIYMGQTGELFKAFNIKDGYGINNILKQHKIIPVIITARESKIVELRCKELNVTHIYQGCKDKISLMQSLAKENGIAPNAQGILEGTAYIGDDLIDLQCIHISQYSGCPIDAVKQVRDSVDYVSEFEGGNGAVRDFIEWLVE